MHVCVFVCRSGRSVGRSVGLYVCMYVCMYVRMYVCMCAHVYGSAEFIYSMYTGTYLCREIVICMYLYSYTRQVESFGAMEPDPVVLEPKPYL